jgi:uncharacterized protein YggU (UPF0235/DUF167 family)
MADLVPTRPPSVRIKVLVSPRACGDEVLGWAGEALRISVAATGRKGRADAAVEGLLAEVLGVPRDSVHVVAGRGTRRKWVEIENCDNADVERRLPGRAEPAQHPPRPKSASSAVQPVSRPRSRRGGPGLRRSTAS